MAVSYGFFDSQNGDRKYNAQQMTEFYSGIVTNGVFQHVSNGLAVSAGTGLNVSVAAGRAIIKDHWVKNDAALTVAVPAASATYARVDAIVIRYSSANRNITITVKEGTAAASPVAPSMTRDGSTYEMALAYVNVPKNASSVTVTDKRSDSSVCGWAAVAQATSGEVDQMLNAMKTGFDGVVYSSPVAMVQGCDEVLHGEINSIRKWAGKNYFNYENIVNGKSINSEGELVNAAAETAQSTIEYIPIDAGESYIISNNGASLTFPMVVVAFYNASKEFISRVTNVTSFTTPANTVYYRATGVPFASEKVQIEKGTTITPYEPYWVTNNDHIIIDITRERSVGKYTISGAYSEEILKAVGELRSVEPESTATGYYPYTDDNFVSLVGFQTDYFEISDSLPFFYSGKLLGSAGVSMAVFFDAENNIIGRGDKKSSSTAVSYTNYRVDPIAGAVKVAFCAYTSDGSTLTIRRYAKSDNVNSEPTPSVDRFIGHNNLPKFDTDYCHIICYGQSLSNGSDSLYVTDPALPDCYMLGALATPSATLNTLRLTSGNQHPVVSAVNCLHDLLWKNTNLRPSLIAGSYGVGGQSIAQLMSPARQAEIKVEDGYTYDIVTSGRYQVFLDSLTYGKQVADVNEKSISCPIIFFLQGERDYYTDEELSDQPGSVVQAYACGDDKDKYKLYMKRLKDDMQAACMTTYGQTIKPLFAIYQVSGTFVKKHDMGIDMAQIEFAEENDDVILLPAPYFVPNYSSAHLATNGYRWFGEYMAQAAFQTLVQRSDYATMLYTDLIIDGNNIRMKVRNAVLPMCIDNYTVEQATGNGFAVWADDVRITVSDVEIFGDEITVKTGTNLASATKVEISYGGYEVDGTGNIRDSSPFTAMYNYWDDTNDKGQSNTLTISHRPEDKDGNSMIGKKYPMFNWLSLFYKRIK